MRVKMVSSGIRGFGRGCLSMRIPSHVLGVVACVGPLTAAEPRDQSVPPEIANQPADNRTAHAHSADMSCCAPCVPTAADEDPDVAKRPCFVAALQRQRVLPKCFQYPEAVGPGGQEVTMADRLRALELGARVVCEKWCPADSEGVEWSRPGVSSSDIHPHSNRVEGRWSAEGIGFWLRAINGSNYLVLRLALNAKERIDLRFRNPQEEVGAWARSDDVNPQDIVNKGRLLEVLRGYLRFPFENIDEFVVKRGHTSLYAGVPVFTATLHSRYQCEDYYKDDPPDDSKLRWYDEVRILITDSQPQYFCIDINLDRSGEPR